MEWYDPELSILSPSELVPGVDFLNGDGGDGVGHQAQAVVQSSIAATTAQPAPPGWSQHDGPGEKSGEADGPAPAKGVKEDDGGTRKSTTARRPASRLPRQAVRVLEQWLARHREAPYPSAKRLSELQAESGLERNQVLNWFANARKRGKARPPQQAEQQQQQPSASTLYDQQRLSALFSQTACLHPLERWLYSDMESEVASLADIQEAIKAGQVDPLPCRGPSRWLSRARQFHDLTNDLDCQYDESFASSMEIRSYAANALSVSSGDWKWPDHQHHHGHPQSSSSVAAGRRKKMTARRRYKRNSVSLACSRSEGRRGAAVSELDEGSVATSGPTVLRRFQCTFCDESFKRKHDWQRHEKSQHLPLERWTCCPDGSVHVDPQTNAVTCVFCGDPDPDPEHIAGHGYAQCVARPVAERTFYRKDHLGQHVRLMHGATAKMTACMDGWRSAVTTLQSRCGFCSAKQGTWQARIDHIAEHFRDGETMAGWRGDWGFGPEIMAILERAVLPEERMVLHGDDGGSVVPASEYVLSDTLDHVSTDKTRYPLDYSYQGDETLSYMAEPSAIGSWDGLDSLPGTFPWPDMVDLLEAPCSIDGTMSSMLYSGGDDMDGVWTESPFSESHGYRSNMYD